MRRRQATATQRSREYTEKNLLDSHKEFNEGSLYLKLEIIEEEPYEV